MMHCELSPNPIKSPKLELKWYVVYTRPKAERKVASSITQLGIESYLPVHSVMRKWSDRLKKIEVPLFPNYVFVKVDALARGHLFSIKELVRFVAIDKRPVVLREVEVLALKKALNENLEVTPEEYFQEGMTIKITQGHFAGLTGVVIKKSGRARLVVRIHTLMRAFSFNLSANMVEAVQEKMVVIG